LECHLGNKPNFHTRRDEAQARDVLRMDAERETRALTTAGGLKRLYLRLPWPLRVLPPILIALIFPLLGRVIASGVFVERRPAPLHLDPMVLEACSRPDRCFTPE
jgi:hypothetical protein